MSNLDELIRAAKAAIAAMTPEQQASMLIAQRQSWVRAELGFGSDADEAAYRSADADGRVRLDAAAAERMAQIP